MEERQSREATKTIIYYKGAIKTMKTYQDMLKVSEQGRGKFCRQAVEEFKGTTDYKNAQAGQAYYDKHNLTIEQYQKCYIRLVAVK